MTRYRQKDIVFTYSTLVRPQNYPLNYRTILGCRVGEGLHYLSVKLLSDYLNVCDHNPPTLQTDEMEDILIAIPY